MMRALVVAAVLIPLAARADDAPIPAGTWYVLRADAGPPRCEAWSATGDGHLAIAGWDVSSTSEGARVYLGAAVRGDDRVACGEAWSVHDTDVVGDLDVDGARWFLDRAACTAAVAHHARLAMELPACLAPPAPPPPAASRATFERLLVRGGALFAAADCTRVAVRPSEHSSDSARGAFVTVGEDADWRTTTREPYDLAFGADKIILPPPHTESVAVHPGLWGTGSYGCVCVDDRELTFGEDWVDFGQRYYFSAASCRRDARAARVRASWRPVEDDCAPPARSGTAGPC